LTHEMSFSSLKPSCCMAKPTEWMTWLVPLTGAIAFLVVTDRRNMQARIHPDASLRERSSIVSDTGVGALASVPLLLYGRGWHEGDGYARDSGILGARAVLDTLLAAEAIRLVDETMAYSGHVDWRFHLV